MDYDSNDLYWEWDGDYATGKDGDLKDNIDDAIKPLTQEIQSIIRSEFGDSWFSIRMPLSDKVLIDILTYSIKKFNKLKTALETLK